MRFERCALTICADSVHMTPPLAQLGSCSARERFYLLACCDLVLELLDVGMATPCSVKACGAFASAAVPAGSARAAQSPSSSGWVQPKHEIILKATNVPHNCTYQRRDSRPNLRPPLPYVSLYALVVGVELGLHQHEGGDAAHHLGDVARLLGLEVAAEQRALAVAQPLLDDLLAADRVAPHVGRHASPVRDVVEVHIETRLAEEGDRLLGRHAERFGVLGDGGALVCHCDCRQLALRFARERPQTP